MIHDLKLGDVPTWLAALFGGAAAVAALVQLSRQRRELRRVGSALERLQAEQLDLELEPQRQAARRARRRQAQDVTIYRGQANLTRGDSTQAAFLSTYIAVTNLSGEPVRRVDVRFGSRPADRVGQLDHSTTEPQELREQRTSPIEVLHHGEAWYFVAPESEREIDNREIIARFDDADERRWEANPDRRLEDAPDTSW